MPANPNGNFLATMVTVTLAALLPTSIVLHADPEANEDQLSELIIPLNAESEPVQRALREALETIPMAMPRQPKTGTTADGGYVLYGDLFKTGRYQAFAEMNDHGCMGFAVRKGKTWEVLGLWKIVSEWRPEGWHDIDGDHLPIRPSTRPFWLMNLSADKVPELVVTGEVWKYWQEYHIMRFNSKTGRLNLSADAMEEPEYRDGWVVLPFGSGHRAIYRGCSYCQWDGCKLVEKARWQDGINEDDSPEYDTQELQEVSRLGADGKTTRFQVKHFADQESKPVFRRLIISRDGLPFAEVEITWTPDSRDALKRFLFTRLTGLPLKLFPEVDHEPHRKLEDIAKIRVKGQSDAVRLLAPKPQSRH